MDSKTEAQNYLQQIYQLTNHQYYLYETQSLVSEDQRKKLICKYCYTPITLEKDTIKTISRNEAIQKQYVPIHVKKHMTFILCTCHNCHKNTLFIEDTYFSRPKTWSTIQKRKKQLSLSVSNDSNSLNSSFQKSSSPSILSSIENKVSLSSSLNDLNNSKENNIISKNENENKKDKKKEKKEKKPKKMSEKDENEFRKALMNQMKQKTKEKQSKQSSEARANLLSFLKEVDN